MASSFGKESFTEGLTSVADPNVVVLPKFEDVARRQTGKEPASPALRRVKTEEEDTMQLSEPEQEANEEGYMHQFRDVVWRQLVPAELDQLDGMERSSVVIIEAEAQYFPPVCLTSSV